MPHLAYNIPFKTSFFSLVFLWLFLYNSSINQAQIQCTAQDKTLVLEKLTYFKSLKQFDELTINETAVKVGKSFLGTEYVAKTLDINENGEELVINLHGLDCTTFLENVLVFSRLIKQGKYEFEDYVRELELVRYRDGKVENYNSRLHYFSDWLYENEQKGLIKQKSKTIAQTPFKNDLNFMTNNRDKYVQLGNEVNYEELKSTEKTFTSRNYYYIPKEVIKDHEKEIKNGDLIAITTNIKGLDIVHVGFAIHQNGRLHLLHASSKQKKVVISTKPLHDYLAPTKYQTGIMVAEILSPRPVHLEK
ncbi:N-acetylmuramoyl-L-alanine amidase-like domain-containing protein [Flexithrix dorotheae]|uniref:N-acetylmuramoyl-L-alanine amidase-like domain-containing protein n=1 Tax=Flexithrix dorotheae TaxID=70993 RepID=UPI0003664FAE|nr:N-acetylmuramoyl-L-alanine amidase-like domain-containing protein [Flexithrix dorotheae]